MAFDWLRGKFRRRRVDLTPGVPAGELPSPPGPDTAGEEMRRLREELDRERTARATAEDTAKKYQFKQEQEAKAQAQAEYEGKVPPRARTAEEIISKLPEKEQKKYRKRIEEGKRAQVEAELEIWESGIPGKKKIIHRVWNPAQQTWEFKEVEVPLTPQERLAEARIQRVGGMLIEEEVASLQQRKRERGVPYRLARGAGETAKHLTAVGMLGIAGTAQAMQPGRGGPQRASRMLAPRVPMEMYSIGTPSVDLSGLRRPLRPRVSLGGLEHLRGAVMPRVRRRE